MGLDMNLKQRVYIGAEFDHRNITGSIDIKHNGDSLDIPLCRVETIILDAGYWRKANQIHKWFVDKCQGGVDECQASYVSYDQLKELLALCKLIHTAKKGSKEQISLIDKELPPESGFFFGNVNTQEGDGLDMYLEDIEETITIIEKLDPEGEYEYQASW